MKKTRADTMKMCTVNLGKEPLQPLKGSMASVKSA